MSLKTHVRITGDGKSLEGATKLSEAGLKRVRGAAKGAADGLDRTSAAGKRYENRAGSMARKSRLLAAGLSSVVTALGARQLIQADLQLGAIEASMQGVAGSANAAQKELTFIRAESERLGVVMPEVAQGFIRISAAAKGTELEGAGVRDIWLSLVEAGVVLQRTNADVAGTLFAVEQMISKGTVTAEELKRQMGDRLPGAFQLAADAMSVSTQELTKMMEAGEIITTDFLPKFAAAVRERYGEGLTAAMALPRAEINRLKNDLFEFAAETSRAGLTDGLVEAIASLRTALSDPELRASVADLSELMGNGFALAGASAAFLASNTDELVFVVRTLLALNVLRWATVGDKSLLAQARSARTAAAGMTAMGIATRGASGAMTLLGGPIGLAVIGLSALAFAVTKHNAAMKASIGISRQEKELLSELNELREESVNITKENVDELERENRALAAKKVNLTLLQSATAEAVQAQITAAEALQGFQLNRKSGSVPRWILLSTEQMNILGLATKDARQTTDGFEVSFKQAQKAVDKLRASVDAYPEELEKVQARLDEIAAARKKWADEEAKAEAARTSAAKNALTDLRDQLNLEIQLAGMSKQQADTERLAQQIFEKAQKAKSDLTLEQARIEAASFVQRRDQAVAVQEWTQIEIDLQTRLRNAGMNPDDVSRLAEAQELLNVARAAGQDITLAEIVAKLELIDEEERLKEARAEYDQYLAFLSEETELAKLSAEARAEELIYLELKRLALLANKDLTEDELRLIAKTVVASRKADAQVQRSVQQSRRVMERTLRGFSTAVWDLFTGRAGDALDQVGRMIDRAVALWLQKMILEPLIRPILEPIFGLGGGGVPGAAGAVGLLGAGGGNVGLFGGLGLLLGGIEAAALQVGGSVATLLGRVGVGTTLSTQIGAGLGLGIAGAPWAFGGTLAGQVLGLNGYQNGTVQAGANFIGGGLGFLAGGPLGAIIGGVISQALGTLFADRDYPYARADVNYLNGQFIVGGTESLDGGPTDDVNAAGQAVAVALNQIAAALGLAPGDLRNGAYTTIGLSSGRSDALGEGFFAGADGGFATGATFTGLETPEDAIFRSVQFAVQQMIQQAFSGPIEDAALALLAAANSVSDLDKAIADVVTARDLERQLELVLLGFQNPEEQAKQQLLDQQKLRRDEVDRLAALGLVSDGVYASLSQIEALELEQVLRRFGDSVESAGFRARSGISNWLAAQAVNDNTPLGIFERLGNAKSQYQELLSLAQGGDADALSQITRAADTLLALDREATSSAIDRLSLFSQVRADLEALALDDGDPVVNAIGQQTIELVDAIGGVQDPNLEIRNREPNPDLPPGLGGIIYPGGTGNNGDGLPEIDVIDAPEIGFRPPPPFDPLPFEIGTNRAGYIEIRDQGQNSLIDELNRLFEQLRRGSEQNTASLSRALEQQARATRESANQQRRTDNQLSRISARLRGAVT